MSFATTLRAYRRRAGMSQNALADLTGVDHSYCSRLESGERRPSPGMVQRITEELELDVDEAVGLYLSAGYLPPWVMQNDGMRDLLRATIMLHTPRARTVAVKREVA